MRRYELPCLKGSLNNRNLYMCSRWELSSLDKKAFKSFPQSRRRSSLLPDCINRDKRLGVDGRPCTQHGGASMQCRLTSTRGGAGRYF